MKNHKIKLVASDLDGTLLNTDKHLSKKTFDAINRLLLEDIIFVPSTGRSLHSVPKFIKDIPSLKYLITSNGAVINHLPTNSNIASFNLSPAIVTSIIEIIRSNDIMIEAFSKGFAYCDENTMNNLSRYGVFGSHADYVLKTRTHVKNIYTFFEENINHIENINLIFKDLNLRTYIFDILSKELSECITSSSPYNLEIASPFASKGKSLKHLCSLLKINMDHVMCFGDGENDIDMFEICQFSFAMENSQNNVKLKASYLAPHCNEDGVAKILDDYIFHNSFI